MLESKQVYRWMNRKRYYFILTSPDYVLSPVLQDRKILQRIFDRIDSKKDNKIDKEELEQTLQALGYEPVKVS